jgi:hypothetical protein
LLPRFELDRPGCGMLKSNGRSLLLKADRGDCVGGLLRSSSNGGCTSQLQYPSQGSGHANSSVADNCGGVATLAGRVERQTRADAKDRSATPRGCAVGAARAFFYASKEHLVEICVPFLKAGLESNELCVWVFGPPLTEKDAWAALRYTNSYSRSIPGRPSHRDPRESNMVSHRRQPRSPEGGARLGGKARRRSRSRGMRV